MIDVAMATLFNTTTPDQQSETYNQMSSDHVLIAILSVTINSNQLFRFFDADAIFSFCPSASSSSFSSCSFFFFHSINCFNCSSLTIRNRCFCASARKGPNPIANMRLIFLGRFSTSHRSYLILLFLSLSLSLSSFFLFFYFDWDYGSVSSLLLPHWCQEMFIYLSFIFWYQKPASRAFTSVCMIKRREARWSFS